jgi:hypothetical protein
VQASWIGKEQIGKQELKRTVSPNDVLRYSGRTATKSATKRPPYDAPKNHLSNSLITNDLRSRGGTRTRDPGIMSESATPSDLDSTSDDAA